MGVGLGVGVAEGVTEADALTEEEDADADDDTMEADDVTCVDESFDEPHAVNTRAAAATTLQRFMAKHQPSTRDASARGWNVSRSALPMSSARDVRVPKLLPPADDDRGRSSPVG